MVRPLEQEDASDRRRLEGMVIKAIASMDAKACTAMTSSWNGAVQLRERDPGIGSFTPQAVKKALDDILERPGQRFLGWKDGRGSKYIVRYDLSASWEKEDKAAKWMARADAQHARQLLKEKLLEKLDKSKLVEGSHFSKLAGDMRKDCPEEYSEVWEFLPQLFGYNSPMLFFEDLLAGRCTFDRRGTTVVVSNVVRSRQPDFVACDLAATQVGSDSSSGSASGDGSSSGSGSEASGEEAVLEAAAVPSPDAVAAVAAQAATIFSGWGVVCKSTFLDVPERATGEVPRRRASSQPVDGPRSPVLHCADSQEVGAAPASHPCTLR